MSVPDEAWQLIVTWLPANDDPDRPQITLSTVSEDGGADARTVLMTEFDQDGFYFHTDGRSRKVAEIRANPGVAITVLWPGFTKQLVIRGTAEVAPAQEISRAYESRSPYLKQLAWQNYEEFAQLSLDERRAQWADFAAEHGDDAGSDSHGPDSHAWDLPAPETWTGYLVRPTQLTFWGSNPDTASHRVEFVRDPGGEDTWTRRELAG
jgi:pyridoxamine 5'-phosphate oxidase